MGPRGTDRSSDPNSDPTLHSAPGLAPGEGQKQPGPLQRGWLGWGEGWRPHPRRSWGDSAWREAASWIPVAVPKSLQGSSRPGEQLGLRPRDQAWEPPEGLGVTGSRSRPDGTGAFSNSE